MVEEPLLLLRRERVEALLLAHGAQCGDSEHLGLAPREQAGTVSSRQDPHLGAHGTDLGGASAVGADTLRQDAGPDLLLELLVEGGEYLLRGVRLTQPLHQLLAPLPDRALTLLLVHRRQQLLQLPLQEPRHLPPHLILHLRQGHRHLGLTDVGYDLVLESDDLLIDLMPRADAAQDDLLGYAGCPSLDHHHRVAGAGDHQVDAALLELVIGGIDHVLPIHIPHPDRAYRPGERYLRHAQGGRGTDGSQDIGVVLLVGGEHSDDDLHVVPEALGEQGTQRPVGETGRQDSLSARTPLPTEEAARDLASGIQPLLIVDGEGEEVDALPRPVTNGGRNQDHGLAVGDHRRAVGLACDLPRLDNQRSPGYRTFISMRHYQ